jgi:hypothetical protein
MAMKSKDKKAEAGGRVTNSAQPEVAGGELTDDDLKKVHGGAQRPTAVKTEITREQWEKLAQTGDFQK